MEWDRDMLKKLLRELQQQERELPPLTQEEIWQIIRERARRHMLAFVKRTVAPLAAILLALIAIDTGICLREVPAYINWLTLGFNVLAAGAVTTLVLQAWFSRTMDYSLPTVRAMLEEKCRRLQGTIKVLHYLSLLTPFLVMCAGPVALMAFTGIDLYAIPHGDEMHGFLTLVLFLLYMPLRTRLVDAYQEELDTILYNLENFVEDEGE